MHPSQIKHFSKRIILIHSLTEYEGEREQSRQKPICLAFKSSFPVDIIYTSTTRKKLHHVLPAAAIIANLQCMEQLTYHYHRILRSNDNDCVCGLCQCEGELY